MRRQPYPSIYSNKESRVARVILQETVSRIETEERRKNKK